MCNPLNLFRACYLSLVIRTWHPRMSHLEISSGLSCHRTSRCISLNAVRVDTWWISYLVVLGFEPKECPSVAKTTAIGKCGAPTQPHKELDWGGVWPQR